MASDLPDELLSQILSLLLDVPEARFSKLTDTSPFSKYAGSTSAILLVCKTWLRIGTPLLYEVIVLRSTAQALALCTVLRANSYLGNFIKRLRVEGGYGLPMQSILQSAPQITDLFISCQIHPPDSVSGLVSGFQFINPTRLIIFDQDYHLVRNAAVKRLLNALKGSVNQWSNLSEIVFPYAALTHPRTSSFVLDLCTSSKPKTISFPPQDFPDVFSEGVLVQLAQLSTLVAIEIRGKRRVMPPPLIQDPRLATLLRWGRSSKRVSAKNRELLLQPSLHSELRPMARVLQPASDRIWHLILLFAMHIDETGAKTLPSKKLQKILRRRTQYLLVSTTFYRLGITHLYRDIVLSNISAEMFASTLDNHRALGQHVVSLTLHTSAINHRLAQIFPHLPQLQRLVGDCIQSDVDNGSTLSWPALRILAQTAGPTLEVMTGFAFVHTQADAPRPPAILARFARLRRLSWVCPPRASRKPYFDSAADIPTDVLDSLENLDVWSPQALPLLTKLNLPVLKRLSLKLPNYAEGSTRGATPVVAFLRKHGAKLTSLATDTISFLGKSIFTLCPNITELRCTLDEPNRYDLGTSALPDGFLHSHLNVLELNKESFEFRGVERWEAFCSTLRLSHLPALREVRMHGVRWPKTEHQIALQRAWVDGAETLIERGLKVVDRTGVAWRPRLQ